jgi:hypothetical protein
VNPTKPSSTQRLLDPFNPQGDLFGRFDMVDLDIDDAQPKADARIDIIERIQIAGWPVGQLKDNQVGVLLKK